MAKLNVILEARGRDKGASKLLKGLAKLADEYAESAKSASAAGSKLGRLPPAPSGGGRGRGGPSGGGSRGPSGGGARRSRAGSSVAAFEKARARELKQQISVEKKIAKASQKAQREGAKEQRKIAQSLKRQQREQAKSARQVENMSDAQLEGVELQRETNRRRKRMARRKAEDKMGPDASLKGRGAAGRLETAENLATVGAEFEVFADRAQAGMTSTLDSFKDYEKGVAEVSTLTDDISVDEIMEITKAASAEFGGLPTDQVKAFYNIVSAGATTATEAQQQLEAANKLAIGGVATQEEAVLAISKSVANFEGSLRSAAEESAKDAGIPFDESKFNAAAEASDILFAAVQRGQTTVSELARAIPAVANAADRTGLSMDETAAAVSFLSTKLPSASEASTGFAAALSNIEKPSKMARKEAKRLGIDFSKAGIEAAGGLEAWLLKLAASEKLTDKSLGKLFESKNARAAIGGLTSDMEGFHSVLGDTSDAAGKTAGAYEKMADTGAQKTARFEAQMELMKIQMGEGLLPAAMDLVKEVTPLVTKFTEFMKNNKDSIPLIGKVAFGLIAATRALAGLSKGVSMYNAIAGLMEMRNNKAAASTVRLGAASTAAGGKVSKMGQAGAMIKGPLAVAAVALFGFEAAMNAAEEATGREMDRLDEVNKAGLTSFAQQEGESKEGRDRRLLMERRERLVADVRGKEALRNANTGDVARQQFSSGNLLDAAGSLGGGIVDMVSGVDDVQQGLVEQAVSDLDRFDRQYGEQLGYERPGVTDQPTGPPPPGVVTDALAGLLETLNTTMTQVAANTAGQDAWWDGPSMEAGAV